MPTRPVVPPVRVDDPQKIGTLPSDLTGNLGSAKSLGDAIRLPVAGRLPSPIKGNFNNIVPEPIIPYGRIGFYLICRSASDFTTILAILRDYTSLGYAEELSAVGAGSVSLSRDDPLVLDQLVNGTDIEALLEKDNLWEVYFDGKRKFMWLGQNVQETLVDSNEERVITISGPGLGQSLEWGLVLPNKFPAMKPKIETVVEDFLDQDIDTYGLWKSSAGTIQNKGGRVDITVVDTSSTGSFLATDYGYDITDSGVQVRVVPYIGPNGAGQQRGKVRTLVYVDSQDGLSVRMYTDLNTDGVGYSLVAETATTQGLETVRIPFDAANHHYWRMQELDGNMLFSYRKENTTDLDWVNFAALPYSFDAANVRLRLKLDAVAGTNITLPRTSTFSLINVGGVASPLKPMARYRRLLQRAQARGTLKHLIPRWTDTRDSDLIDWVSDATVDVQVGADLLSVLSDYCDATSCDWYVDSEFRLNVLQRIDRGDLDNPTPSLVSVVADEFDRDEINGFGTAPTGQTWEHLGNPNAFSVTHGVGRHTHTTTNTGRHSIVDVGSGNSKFVFAVAVPERSSGTTGYTAYGMSRIPSDNSSDNVYQVRIAFLTDGRVTCTVRKREEGIPDSKVNIVLPNYTYTPGVFHFVEMETDGAWVRGRVWPVTWPKPVNWQVEWEDPNPLPETNTKISFHTLTEPGNTNTYPFDFLISTFQASAYHSEVASGVTFYEAESQDSKARSRVYSNVRNYVVGKTEGDEFLVKKDQTSINSFQQRETLLSSSQTKDLASLETVIDNHLTTVKNGTNSWTLTVPHNISGKRLYLDYVLGDWVWVQSAFPFRRDAWRVVAIAVKVDGDGEPVIELTLNDKLTPYWLKVREEIKRQRWPLPPRRGLPGRSQNPGWYAA